MSRSEEISTQSSLYSVCLHKAYALEEGTPLGSLAYSYFEKWTPAKIIVCSIPFNFAMRFVQYILRPLVSCHGIESKGLWNVFLLYLLT